MSMDHTQISDRDFGRFQVLIRDIAGIRLSSSKKALLCGRLARRLRDRKLDGYDDYYHLVTSSSESQELDICVDLLTTNETYFFRESRHFDYLREQVLPKLAGQRGFRAWSAACSTGEEAYSIAMLAAEAFRPEQWEVIGSDINTSVLQRAVKGQYSLERAKHIPKDLLHKHCLKGVGRQDGTLLVNGELRRQVRFARVNLNKPLSAMGEFDVIFLRNVMIYFDDEVKRGVVARIVRQIRPGGWLFVGHSESLNGFSDEVRAVAPTVYRKPG